MAKFKKGDKIVRIYPRSNKKEHGVILDKYSGPDGSEYYHILWDSGDSEIRRASIADIDLDFDFDLLYGVSNTADKCNHRWKTYVGFTEQYEYCELCNAKRDLTY
jgi:hypothetical protein